LTDFKVSEDKVIRKNYRVSVAEQNNPCSDWYMPFEVATKEKHVEWIKFLDQGSDGTLHSTPLEAFLKLIDELKAEGYTL